MSGEIMHMATPRGNSGALFEGGVHPGGRSWEEADNDGQSRGLNPSGAGIKFVMSNTNSNKKAAKQNAKQQAGGVSEESSLDDSTETATPRATKGSSKKRQSMAGDRADFEGLVEGLLEYIYDPKYKFTAANREFLSNQVHLLAKCTRRVMDKAEGFSLALESQQTLAEKVSLLETTIAKSLEQRAEVAAPAKSAPVTAPSQPRSSYASMLRSKIAKVATPAPAGSARRQTIAVCPADPQKLKTSEATRAELQASVNPAGLNVKALRRGPKAGLILEMEGEDSIARLKAKLPASLKVEEPRKRLPRVIIFDAPADTKVEQVRESLQHLAGESDGMGDAIEQTRVCFDTKPKRAVKNLVVEVHPKIRHVLLRDGRVFISWNSCRVRDYLVSTRCFKCQRYGHVAKHCREKSDTCGHCSASGHGYKDCPRKQEAPVCANCKRRGRDNKHDVRSEACPERARASDALIRTTDYAP